MKKSSILFLFACFFSLSLSAQTMGNYQYSNSQVYDQKGAVVTNNRLAHAIDPNNDNHVYFDVKVLMNAPATSYLAIFSLTQVGKSAKEADAILGERMDQFKSELDSSGVKLDKFYLDMISLVPVYEYDTVKKRFSKTTYNEIPKGFELRKNMHILYKDHNALDKILTIAADKGIFDLVKVEYFTDNPAKIQQKMMEEAVKFIGTKMDHYKQLGVVLDTVRRIVTDDFQVTYPQERYASYDAYCSSTLLTRKRDRVNRATKASTRFYNKVPYNDFDIILNQEYVEPVVQFTANVRIRFNRPPAVIPVKKTVEVKKEKEMIWFTPEGELRTLKIQP